MPGDCAIRQYQIAAIDGSGDVVDYEGVVEAVANPRPEGGHAEENAALGEGVELGISVEEASRDELVEDAESEGRKDCEEDVVEGESPRFVDDGAGEAILEGVLVELVEVGARIGLETTYPKLRHEHGNVLVKRVENDLADAIITPRPMHEE